MNMSYHVECMNPFAYSIFFFIAFRSQFLGSFMHEPPPSTLNRRSLKFYSSRGCHVADNFYVSTWYLRSPVLFKMYFNKKMGGSAEMLMLCPKIWSEAVQALVLLKAHLVIVLNLNLSFVELCKISFEYFV